MGLSVKCFSYGPLAENTYVVADLKTGMKAVIDPGCFGEDVRDEIGDPSNLRYILLTHGHYDHFAAAQQYIDAYPGAVFAAPENEEYLLHGGRDNKWMALGKGSSICPEADLLLKEGDTVELGETVFRIIGTPGHTEGGICYCTDREVFTGDTLFRSSIGNSSLETGCYEDLESSIRNKLYVLDDELEVRPGHGPETTIGYEKKTNPYVKE